MAIDPAGNLYVVDGRYHNVTGVGPTSRKITPAGVVSTIAGRADLPPGLVDGPVASAQLTVDTGAPISDSHAWLAVDASGNVYVTDRATASCARLAPMDRSARWWVGPGARDLWQ
jgi:hypothetical protein